MSNTAILIVFMLCFAQSSCIFAKYLLSYNDVWPRKKESMKHMNMIQFACEGTPDDDPKLAVCGLEEKRKRWIVSPISEDLVAPLAMSQLPLNFYTDVVTCRDPEKGETINYEGIELSLERTIFMVCVENKGYEDKTIIKIHQEQSEDLLENLDFEKVASSSIQKKFQHRRFKRLETPPATTPIVTIYPPNVEITGPMITEEDFINEGEYIDPNSEESLENVRVALDLMTGSPPFVFVINANKVRPRILVFLEFEGLTIDLVEEKNASLSSPTSIKFNHKFGCVPKTVEHETSNSGMTQLIMAIRLQVSCELEARNII